MCPVPGIRTLRVGNLSIPLTGAKHTDRAIGVQAPGGGICWAPLTLGQSPGALNINISGQVWHAR
jgi:hypothetical protein